MLRHLVPLALASCFALLPAVTGAEETPAPAATPAAGSTPPAAPTSTQPTEADVLAAARVANDLYQRNLNDLINRLEDPEKRADTIYRLSLLDDPAALPFITPYLDSVVHGPELLNAACRAVARMHASSAEQLLMPLTRHADESVRINALNALSAIRKANAPALLPQDDKVTDARLRSTAAVNLGVQVVTDAGDLLLKALAKDQVPHVRRMAAIGLGRLNNSAHGPALVKALADPDAMVRTYVARSLAQLDYKPAVPYLLIALEANVAGPEINKAVMQLSGEDFGFNTHGTILERRRAVDRGIAWWAAHPDLHPKQ